MQRSFSSVWTGLSLLLATAAPACILAEPRQEALVDAGSSSIREPIHVTVYGDGDYCYALRDLPHAAVPSRSLVPRPRDLADEVAPVMQAFGVRACTIEVRSADDAGGPDARDEGGCRRGEFRFSGGSWSTVEDDASCSDYVAID